MYSVIRFERAASRRNVDSFSIAPVPHEETCTPAGQSREAQILECTALINQVIRIIGPAPEGAEFFIVGNHDHEQGSYYEAGIFYAEQTEMQYEADEDTPSLLYAQLAETSIPDFWDDAAKQELQTAGHPAYQPAKVIQMKAA